MTQSWTQVQGGHGRCGHREKRPPATLNPSLGTPHSLVLCPSTALPHIKGKEGIFASWRCGEASVCREGVGRPWSREAGPGRPHRRGGYTRTAGRTLLEGRRWLPHQVVPIPSLHLSPASSTVCSCDTGVETSARGSKPFLKCLAQTVQPPGWVKLGPYSRWALCFP